MYDIGCNGIDYFHLCQKGHDYYDDSDDCVFDKQGTFDFIYHYPILEFYLTNSTLTNSIALFCFLDATPTPPPTTEPPGKWHLAPTGKFKTD